MAGTQWPVRRLCDYQTSLEPPLDAYHLVRWKPGITTSSKTNNALTRPLIGMVPQLTYYSRVGLELGKLIAHQRSMAPP